VLILLFLVIIAADLINLANLNILILRKYQMQYYRNWWIHKLLPYFLKPCTSIFGDFEYLEWLESSIQALSISIGTTYMVM